MRNVRISRILGSAFLSGISGSSAFISGISAFISGLSGRDERGGRVCLFQHARLAKEVGGLWT